MANNKRKAQEAFGRSKPKKQDKTEGQLFSSDGVSNGQLSAFAAARKATQPTIALTESDIEHDDDELVTTIAGASYDGHHSGTATPGVLSDDDEPLPIRSRPNVQLSTFTRRKGNVLRDDADELEVRLKTEERVTVIGEYDLRVVTGVATVYGAMLHPESDVQRVYAPSISALPSIVAKKDGTIIRLISVRSGFVKLERVSPLFRNIGAKDADVNRSFASLANSSDDALQRALVPLEIDDDSKRVLSRISSRLDGKAPPTRIMALGAKSSGKSTFNRILCNMMLSRAGVRKCLYLDLDPGQPEFGPPGQLSLVEVNASILGPAFSHPASTNSPNYRLLRSHTIAATSFKDDPEHYVGCALDLVQHVDNGTPLIINSCGWVNGLGASTLESITSKLSITDLVLLEPVDSELAHTLSQLVSGQIHRLPRRQRQPGSRAPDQLRAMQNMAYFYQKVDSAPAKWSTSAIQPNSALTVPYAGDESAILGIVSYGQSPHPDFLCEVLEGALVAIVVLESPETFDRDSIAHTAGEGLPYLPADASGHTPSLDPRCSHCVGLALVRGVDVEEKVLHLATPLSDTAIDALKGRQVVLVRGTFDPPHWAYLAQLPGDGGPMEDVDVPWVSRKEPVGIEGSVWRLRHPPMAKDAR